MIKKPAKNRQNFKLKGDEPPPSYDDLKFESVAWHLRYGANKTPALSAQCFQSYLGDKSLTWELGKEIEGAGKVLAGDK